MSLTLQEIEHIAKLARLELSAEEKERFRQQLSVILEYAATLQTVETGEIEPISNNLPPRMVLRADEIQPGLSLEELLENAPQSAQSQLRVPPVME